LVGMEGRDYNPSSSLVWSRYVCEQDSILLCYLAMFTDDARVRCTAEHYEDYQAAFYLFQTAII